MDLSAYHIRPVETEPDIQLPLLDAAWTSGEAMSPIVDLATASGHYKASAVKRIGKFPVGALASDGGQWGNIRFKPNEDSEGFYTADPLEGSDSVIKNALDYDLYNSSGSIVYPAGTLYMASKRIIRTWVFQDLFSPGTDIGDPDDPPGIPRYFAVEMSSVSGRFCYWHLAENYQTFHGDIVGGFTSYVSTSNPGRVEPRTVSGALSNGLAYQFRLTASGFTMKFTFPLGGLVADVIDAYSFEWRPGSGPWSGKYYLSISGFIRAGESVPNGPFPECGDGTNIFARIIS